MTKKKKRKFDFSKFIVSTILISTWIFVALCFITFWIFGAVPEVLVDNFFKIYILELFALAAIKISGNIKEVNKHKYDMRYGQDNYTDDDYLGG